MSLIKLAGLWGEAFTAAGKAFKSIPGSIKRAATGAKEGVKHGDLAEFALTQSRQNNALKEELGKASKMALEGQKSQANFYNNKIKNLHRGLIGTAIGGVGLGVGGYALGKKDKK